MKRKSISKWMKCFTAGILSAALVLTGVTVLPATVEAEETAPGVIYEERKEDFATWKAQAEKTAPVKPGYLFGGWYTSQSEDNALTEETAGSYDGATVYAKFVPAYVLSVKAQIGSGVTANDDAEASIRILTGLDSLNYQYVGVRISLGNKTQTESSTKTTVYDKVEIGTGENKTSVTAAQTFGEAARYYGAWKIGKISDANDSGIIYVRPYWETMDGTVVYGLAKYVHVEDGYLGYVSVPINVMSGAQAAAGIAKISAANNTDLYTGDIIVEAGRMFDDDMSYNVDGTTVKIVGNGATVGENKSGETLFANVRFKLTDAGKAAMYNTDTSTNEITRAKVLNFSITDSDFSNWDEETVEADLWNIQY